MNSTIISCSINYKTTFVNFGSFTRVWLNAMISMQRLALAKAGGIRFGTTFYRALHSTQFGICFDIDGVLVRGHNPIPEAVTALRLLRQSSNEQLRVPTVFFTNSFSLNAKKAQWLSDTMQITVSGSQVVQAHCPLSVFDVLKDKQCLVIGQGPIVEIARNDLGLKHVVTIEDISKAYPLLDVVDHDKALAASKLATVESNKLPVVETIIVCGEPKRWETPLQLLIDLLLTNGRPSRDNVRSSGQTLPLLMCDPDLQFMGRSNFPRFGNGAFLACLEALFKKVTGSDLKYTAVVGKPSEASYRYAEHCLTEQACKLFSNPKPLKTLYMIGDNAEVDILGGNLYQRYIGGAVVPDVRTLPKEAKLHPQTVTSVVPILVMTGVHRSNSLLNETEDKSFSFRQMHIHNEFGTCDAELFQPAVCVDTVYDAVQYIMKKEQID